MARAVAVSGRRRVSSAVTASGLRLVHDTENIRIAEEDEIDRDRERQRDPLPARPSRPVRTIVRDHQVAGRASSPTFLTPLRCRTSMMSMTS